MTVAELIVKLQEFSPDLPVSVADWNEDYLCPKELQASEIRVVDFAVARHEWRDAIVVGGGPMVHLVLA